MLDLEPTVGMAVVDSQCRTLHANRRFTELTVPAARTDARLDAPGGDRDHLGPRRGVWALVGRQVMARALEAGRPTVLQFIHDGAQVQCNVWPLGIEPESAEHGRPGAARALEPAFLVMAVQGHAMPADGQTPIDVAQASSEGGQSKTTAMDAQAQAQPGKTADPAEASDPAAKPKATEPGQSVEGKPASDSGPERTRTTGFLTLSTTLAELGPLSSLTSRELEVLALIGQGMATKDIALALGRSPRTVERHCDAVHKKLGTANRVQMARYAIRAGLTVESGKLNKV